MRKFAQQSPAMQALAHLLESDPGERRIPALGCQESLPGGVAALQRARRVILISGFYIGRVRAWETDGPLGTLILADALERQGVTASIFTDEGALPIFQRGRRLLDLGCDIRGFSPGAVEADGLLSQLQPDLLIAIERTGRAQDGCYYNANGDDVTQDVAHFDDLFLAAMQAGVETIAVGDGGNELGFGQRRSEAERLLGEAAHIACATPATYLLPCGVSNWGGYALAAAISGRASPDELRSEIVLGTLLTEIVAAGAVDGVSGRRSPTVDGLPTEVELTMYRKLMQERPLSQSRFVG
ncbi:MAG: glutamate cyclase domain-containing protein [Bacillota bacterium]